MATSFKNFPTRISETEINIFVILRNVWFAYLIFDIFFHYSLLSSSISQSKDHACVLIVRNFPTYKNNFQIPYKIMI